MDKFDLTQAAERELLAECLTQMFVLKEASMKDAGFQHVPVHRVLSYVWHTGRLADCKKKLAAGKRMPEFVVTRAILGDDAYYIAESDMHGCEAARQLGKKTVAACVTCTYTIQIIKFGLWRDSLWHYNGHGEWQQQSSGKLPVKTIEGLKRLGIRQRIA